jgi:GT2 family glycosyltransferase
VTVSIVIPTYGRGWVLVDTIELLLLLPVRASELLVMDQTPSYEPGIENQLKDWHEQGVIVWSRLSEPSIPSAMNRGLLEASQPLVLFLDDDIRPHKDLVSEHCRAHAGDPELWATTGQVLQPGETSQPLPPPRKLQGFRKDLDFPFNSSIDTDVENTMAGNLCVNRSLALSIGGFDQNFMGPAYRFETDFARRVIEAGGRIRFVGSATIEHLRAPSGGTRSAGSHLKSASLVYGLGDHYFAFKHGQVFEAWSYGLQRILREVRTRFHLTHPWFIPVKLLGEIKALLRARQLTRQGPKYIATVD